MATNNVLRPSTFIDEINGIDEICEYLQAKRIWCISGAASVNPFTMC